MHPVSPVPAPFPTLDGFGTKDGLCVVASRRRVGNRDFSPSWGPPKAAASKEVDVLCGHLLVFLPRRLERRLYWSASSNYSKELSCKYNSVRHFLLASGRD